MLTPSIPPCCMAYVYIQCKTNFRNMVYFVTTCRKIRFRCVTNDTTCKEIRRKCLFGRGKKTIADWDFIDRSLPNDTLYRGQPVDLRNDECALFVIFVTL